MIFATIILTLYLSFLGIHLNQEIIIGHNCMLILKPHVLIIHMLFHWLSLCSIIFPVTRNGNRALLYGSYPFYRSRGYPTQSWRHHLWSCILLFYYLLGLIIEKRLKPGFCSLLFFGSVIFSCSNQHFMSCLITKIISIVFSPISPWLKCS